MAKADNTTSTDWIWLREALALAYVALGSMVLAKARIREWLATGKLPWRCIEWKALDDEGITERRQRLQANKHSFFFFETSGPYYEGDARFWGAKRLKIDWEDNAACEPDPIADSAHAWGVRVSREGLLALLPEEPRERVEELGQTKPAAHEDERLRGAGTWIAAEAKRMKDTNEIPPDIRISEFARELERRMNKATASDKSLRAIKWRSIKNGLRAWGLWPIDSIK